VAALHRCPAGLTHTVRIGAQSWTTYLGNVSLANSTLSRDGLQQSILTNNGDATGRYSSLSVSFRAPVGEATLFPDLNVLEELRFDSAIGGSGTIRRGPNDASGGYFVSFAVAPPTATVTPSSDSGGGSAVDLIVLGATALVVAPFRLRRRPRRTVMRRPAAIRTTPGCRPRIRRRILSRRRAASPRAPLFPVPPLTGHLQQICA
jgi:hypothetical protein